MKDSSATENYYTIGHIVQFTGLTDRTVRKYISQGLLAGELINGLWHFTPEQAEAFMFHPTVRPSILAKKNAIVYDFLLEDKKNSQQVCMILDLPGVDNKQITEFFCNRINQGGFHEDLQFSFDSFAGSTPRVILKGRADEVLNLLNGYYAEITP